jgi:hypothetical protein
LIIRGLTYFTHDERLGSVFVFEPSAKFVKSMGDIHAANEHGIDIRDEDGMEYLYLSPGNSNLSFTKMTMEGEVVWQKGKKASRRAFRKICTEVALSSYQH